MLNVYSFVIKIGVGSNLVKPALMPSQTLDGERLCRLFAQKTIWVVPSINLESQVYLVDIELIVLTKGCFVWLNIHNLTIIVIWTWCFVGELLQYIPMPNLSNIFVFVYLQPDNVFHCICPKICVYVMHFHDFAC